MNRGPGSYMIWHCTQDDTDKIKQNSNFDSQTISHSSLSWTPMDELLVFYCKHIEDNWPHLFRMDCLCGVVRSFCLSCETRFESHTAQWCESQIKVNNFGNNSIVNNVKTSLPCLCVHFTVSLVPYNIHPPLRQPTLSTEQNLWMILSPA